MRAAALAPVRYVRRELELCGGCFLKGSGGTKPGTQRNTG